MRALTLLSLLTTLPLSVLAGDPQTVVLDVNKMTCAVCPITVKKALQRVPGVTDANVSLKDKTATVKFDPDRTSPAALAKATGDAGFPSAVRK